MTLPLHFSTPPSRILIIKPSAIGDIVHALPVLNLLRCKWPQAHIAWMVTPVCSGLLEGHPQLDEVIPFDRKFFGSTWKNPLAALGLFRFQRDLKSRKFDLVIDLQGLFRSGWLTKKSAAPTRIGFASAREMAWVYYTHRVTLPAGPMHAIDRYLEVAQALGLPRAPVEFVFPGSPSDREFVDSHIPRHKRYAVLLPGTNWATKRWPVERFASLIRPLHERFSLTTVLAGAPNETDLSNRVFQSAVQSSANPRDVPPVVDLTGKTSLRQLIALLRRADLVIANDSGPMHIAAALGRPLVTPYGPTDPTLTGPYRREESVARLDIPCSPCFSRRCSHQSCLVHLTGDSVLEMASRQMAAAR